MIGSLDAAVIDKENGKPHIVKRMDRPGMRVIPERMGVGTLPRQELKEAAGQLTANQAGLIAVGEPTIGKAISNASCEAGRASYLQHAHWLDQNRDALPQLGEGPTALTQTLQPGHSSLRRGSLGRSGCQG